MSAKTTIEWTDRTWNPVRGCTLVSAGCTNCYAMRQAYEGLTRLGPNGPVWTGQIKLVEDALLEPLHWRKPCRVFVNSMSDLFHEDIPREFIIQVFAVMAWVGAYRGHTFQVLTKRSARLRELLNDPTFGKEVAEAATELWVSNGMPNNWTGRWPLPNLHLYVSVEDQATADARIPDLLATPAAVRGISLEPMLGAVDLKQLQIAPGWDELDALTGELTARISGCIAEEGPSLNHVILGGESGRGSRPMHPDWARKVRDDCVAAGVPFFLKQLGEHLEVYVENEGDGVRLYPMDDTRTWTDDGRLKTVEAHGTTFARVGKARAGRVLDGRAWDQMPGEGV